MAGNIKAEAALTLNRGRGRHRAPLLWLVLPFLGGLAASAWIPSGAPAVGRLTEFALLLVLAAIFAGTVKGGKAGLLWGVSLGAAMLCVGVIAGIKTAPPSGVVERDLRARWAGPRSGPGSDGDQARPEVALHPKSGFEAVWADISVLKISPPRPLGRAANPPAGRWLTCSGLGKVLAIGQTDSRLVGQTIYFSLLMRAGEAPPQRSATVRLSGTLRAVPAKGGPDSFNGYLRGLRVAAELSPAWLHGEVRPPSWFAVRCETLADRMSEILGLGFERRADLSAIYRAMMLGRKTGLTPAQKELFVASGTMHLFAINGLHIGIVALSLHALLAILRCPRPIGSLVVLAVLWLDVQSTGASPSALRAFLMAAAAEAAHALWLPTNPLAALTSAAALMLARDPRDVFGASFQMSFGVVTALALLGVPLAGWLQQRYPAYPFISIRSLTRFQRARRTAQMHLLSAAGFGSAAAAVSAVTGVEYFGRFAPSGLIANLALMPLATLVIIAGFASVLCGLAHAVWLSLLFNAASRLLLQAIVAALRQIVTWPGASFSLHYRADWIGPTALCALLGACFWGYAHDWRSASGGWRPPFVVAGFALLFGARLS